MKIYAFCLSALLISYSCTGNKSSQSEKNTEADTSFTVHQPTEELPDYDQSEGMLILEKLGEVYGTETGVDVGFTLKSPKRPKFIEGFYFDREHLIFQVIGDTAKARIEIANAAESNNFKIEAIPESGYSQKELMEIMDELNSRFSALEDGPLKRNVPGFGAGLRYIDIYLMVNTAEKRQEFRDKIMNSPAFRFNGPEIPPINEQVGVNDTLGVYLRPEYTAYSIAAKNVTFILYNYSGQKVKCGEMYFITYQDEPNVWRELPINGNFLAIGYTVADQESRKLTAFMFPDVFPSKPGNYRYFYPIEVNGEKIQMMTEFRLTDDENELVNATKTPIPKAVKQP